MGRFVILAAAALSLCSCLSATRERVSEGVPEGVYTDDYPDDVRRVLLDNSLRIETAEHLLRSGVITEDQAEQARQMYLRRAREVTGLDDLSDTEIATYWAVSTYTVSFHVGPSASQRAEGWLTFTNIMWVLGIALVAICILALFLWQWGPWLFKVLAGVPKQVWEVLLALIGLAGIWAGLYLGAAGPFVALLGCLNFGGTLFLAARLHELKVKPAALFLAGSAVAAVAAVLYGSQMIGFLAVAGLVSALGFCVIATPLCYCIGFKDEASVGRATASGFVMLIAYVVLTAFGCDDNQYLAPFRFGALWIGAFVGYLGLLIASSRWYGSRVNYVAFQVITILAGVAALLFGSLLDIGMVAKIGGTFFVLFLIEKTFEIPVQRRVNYAYLGLLAGGIIFAACWLARSYPEALEPYLFF